MFYHIDAEPIVRINKVFRHGKSRGGYVFKPDIATFLRKRLTQVLQSFDA